MGPGSLFESKCEPGPIYTTPAAIIALWHNETVAVLNQPDIVARITQDGGIPVGNTPQKFAQEIRDETAKWAKVIKTAGIKPQ